MLIGAKDRQVIQKLFADLEHPVTLVVFTEGSVKIAGTADCRYCEQTVQLVKELAELSDKVKAEVVNFHVDKAKVQQYGIARIPAIAVIGARDYGIRYYGVPAGFEFSTLLEAIVDVSKGKADLAPETMDLLSRIDTPVHIQVFVTPTCPYCPAAVRLAHKMALASDSITADMVEAQEFPELARRYNVYGVPRTVINETVHFEGAMPEQYAVLYVLQAAGKLTDEEAKQLAALAR